ncbi:MAG: Ig-like domain-containing protein, partial [Planctomycetota bacterium]|nr:Ig-like domain-containing protein [Planctomycetota bacterium]
ATTCGSPPPSFNYASYNGYMVIARHGDVDAVVCNGNNGSCVGGDYYMELNVVSNAQGPEPVAELRQQYDAWRAGQVGRPDHVKTEVSQTMPRLRADGVSRSSVTVRLRDIEGDAITTGGHAIGVNAKSGQGNIVTVEDIVDNGDGTYTFDFQATQMTGEAEYVVVIDDGVRPVEMYPSLRLSSVAPQELHLGLQEIRISEPTELPIVVDLGGSAAASPYRILGSVSGTAPSTIFAGAAIPLVRDRFFDFTETWAGGVPFTGNAGTLDSSGRAQARMDFPARALTSIAGATMHFSAWTGFAGTPSTAPQGILIVP